MSRLTGRRIVITGASRGVGRETVKLFLNEGAELLGVAKDAARLDAMRRELEPSGQRLQVLALDLESPTAGRELASAVERRWGALDILFNNAGVQIDGGANGLLDGSEAVLTQAMNVNLMAPYRLSVALVPWLERGREPRIVNVSSGAGTFAAMKEKKIASYRLSKWALNGLTLLLASELAGKIAVNAFDPGWVKTDLGGPNAPGTADESARGALAIATLPFGESGKFWKDGQEIPF
jgi:NAD(P)-dependent dehydrogenase (short-subunit alcohol dehydrogenase family)